MFRQWVAQVGPTLTPPAIADNLFQSHPAALIALLEDAWLKRDATPRTPTSPPRPIGTLGTPDNRSNLEGLTPVLRQPPVVVVGVVAPSLVPDRMRIPSADPVAGLLNEFPIPNPTSLPPVLPIRWDHLIYAYMIENTLIYEIFRRVLHEYLHGEKLGIPSAGGQLWLRNTEELFYRDPPPFSITAISSQIRPDLRGTRRNAYHRMFGQDLIKGTDPFVKAGTANSNFVVTFNKLLDEVKIGLDNIRNQLGPNPTNDPKIEQLAGELKNMLLSRRGNGNLSREEFAIVSMMSWFHLTVSFNSDIVRDLRAETDSAAERLFKIAERVGLPAHGLSSNYFDVADDISRVLITIETGALSVKGAAKAFYDDVNISPNTLPTAMRNINNHWKTIAPPSN